MSKDTSRIDGRVERSSAPHRDSQTHRTPPDPDDDREVRTGTDEREGATEKQVGDRTGPGAGYDKEPRQEDDDGGVTPS